MTSIVFVSIGTTVTENTIRLFVERETNVKIIKTCEKGTKKIAELLKEKVSAHMEKTVHTTINLEIEKETTVEEKHIENTVIEKQPTVRN